MPKNNLPILTLLFALFLVFGYSFVQAADTATVTATVTVQNISVTVGDGSVAYGTLATNTSRSTIAADLNDSQTVTNNGNVAEKINVKGQNSGNWTLAATPGSDTYTQKFCITSCSTPPTNFTALTTNYQTLSASVAVAGTQGFDLQLLTPTSTSVFTQQSVDIIVQATTP